jgi:bla regulator protein blaR1
MKFSCTSVIGVVPAMECPFQEGDYPAVMQRVVLKMDFSIKLLLLAVGWTAIALPTALGQGNTPHQAQAVAAQAPVNQTQKVPQWQTAAGGKMSFEVASIRPSKPGTFTPPSFPLSPDDSYTPTAGLFRADFPLMVYIEFAYKLWLTREQRASIVAHLPKWVATDNFEIHARASGNPTKDQMRLMMQSLLADRFKLAIHFETQQVPVLALVLVKPGLMGPKLRPHADGPPCDAVVPTSANRLDVFPHECSVYGLFMQPTHMFLAGSRNTTMELIAASLTSLPGGVDRPVVDQTGLSGKYDFRIEWTPDSNGPASSGADAQPDSQGTTFLEALKEQLGLKLKSTRAPLDVLVVDHVETPSEN